MPQLNIRFHPDRNDLIFPDIEEGAAIWGGITEAVVVANGVQGADGKDRPSVVLRIDTGDGPSVVTITSARLLVSLARMVEAKFQDLMEGD